MRNFDGAREFFLSLREFAGLIVVYLRWSYCESSSELSEPRHLHESQALSFYRQSRQVHDCASPLDPIVVIYQIQSVEGHIVMAHDQQIFRNQDS